jgi:DNA-binding NarL/FixJ family response regulator
MNSEAGLFAIDLGAGDPPSIDALIQLQPAVALIHAQGDRGGAVIRQLRRAGSSFPLVAIGGDGVGEILQLFEGGFIGCVSSDGTWEDVVTAVRRALRGEVTCPPHIIGGLVSRLRQIGTRRLATNTLTRLSIREVEVIELVGLGLTNKEIARNLGIEQSTVKNHVHSILGKVGTHERRDAVARFHSTKKRKRSSIDSS